MFRFLRRLLCLVAIILAAFLAISLRSGGEKFRWFGQKVEVESVKVGRKADNVKYVAGKIENGARNTIRTAKGIVNGIRKK